jgi:hypothetical protein
MKKTPLVVGAVAAAVLTAGVGSATATDWLYYTGMMNVGRVQVDGSARNDSFATFQGMVTGLVATSAGTFATVGSQPAQMYKLGDDGTKTSVGAPLCSTAPNGASDFYSVFATNDQHMYYICEGAPNVSQPRYLARADLSGGSRDESFIDLTGYLAGALAVDANYAYLATATSGYAATNIDRIPLTAGATPTTGPGVGPMNLLITPAGFYWGDQANVGKYAFDFPTLTSTPLFTISGMGANVMNMTGNASAIFWRQGNGPMGTIGKANADGSSPNGSFLAPSGMNNFGMPLAVTSGAAGGGTSGGSSSGGTTPTPAATPAATVLKAPTQSTSADSNGNVAVTLSLQLDEVGKYTFIFEKVTSNEMSREQASSSSRISMQKGTKIGKRKLTKVVTAANVTTTSAGAKLVMRALLKKAQAKKWNLRVIHTATNGTLTQSVIKK